MAGFLGLALNKAAGNSQDFDFMSQVVAHGFLAGNEQFSLHLANIGGSSYVDFGVTKAAGILSGSTSVAMNVVDGSAEWKSEMVGVQFGSDT